MNYNILMIAAFCGIFTICCTEKEYQTVNLENPVYRQNAGTIFFDLNLIDHSHELTFRTLNLANVTGPEHQLSIQVK